MNAPPTHIDHPAAWVGADMAARTGLWIQDLEPAEITELETAARAYDGPIGALNADTFPLPLLCPKLETLSNILMHGIGR